MRSIKISDVTMKQGGKAFTLSFREKIELAKLLDSLGVDVIELEGVGEAFPHRFVADWYDAQNAYVNTLDLTAMTEQPLFRDTADFSQVHVYKNKQRLTKDAQVCLYGDRITVDDRVFPFSQVSAVTVLGKNKVNIYDGQEVFQLKGSKRFNALKYVNFFHRYKNITEGDGNGQFLGL